ncbi:D-alanyl-D-alanine carboxypeptidase/D-alanyl-D-alanine-endopeptidase (penicillin-binding protein 4) [Chitinophaga skermanii]|uniref:D-alanyl-D-alanine carboxypeptidase/D-alanyl-D-alanine-endopeptidase (Penicillin-binding protein 4) n=1 Tax=Chitinophaga skermanii TaxID=331697 RepID=A0A327QP24_9BACT|nr:D-alanyl-D-alanine carboxypeptidase/D-alanyl-D-alanine-endopeptidase [Chitinophaga skermanii]RAJ05093.1 D-alanyl-D-alanine carboxypeptidase/D-alanyl-D-alanine-endopeptidase (penicillin-binding protein 4) [Chitinophaga skermanii]
MKKFLSIAFGCCLLQPAMAQVTEGKLQKALSVLINDEQFKYASYSFYVMDGNTGKKIFSVNENQGLAPASTLKVVTATTAFKRLSPTYQYKTRLQYVGTINPQGVLTGDLIIKGGGDPTLGSPRWQNTMEDAVLKEWVNTVKKAGIKKISGRIIADESIYDTQSAPDGWIIQDMGNYYGAGPSGLTWRENQFDILLQPTQPGNKVIFYQMRPWMPQLTIVNELITGPAGTGDNAYVYSGPFSNTMYLRGSVGADEKNFAIGAATTDPALDCAFRLRLALKADSIDVSNEFTTTRLLIKDQHPLPEDATTLSITQSPTMEKIVYWFLRKSVNLYGEHFVKTFAVEDKLPVSTAVGVQQMRRFWQSLGIDSNALNIYDGSGLSPANRVTTASLARIMYLAQKETWYKYFYEALPTINNIKMKDGYINGVRAYTGYTTPKDGPPLVFALIVNNFSGTPSSARVKMWRLLDELK